MSVVSVLQMCICKAPSVKPQCNERCLVINSSFMGPTPLFANYQMTDQIKDKISLDVIMRKEVVIMMMMILMTASTMMMMTMMMMMVMVMMMMTMMMVMTQDCIVSP